MTRCAAQECQPEPTGRAPTQNLDLDSLKKALQVEIHEGRGSSPVYCYVIASVKGDKDSLCQTGCGPNLQGGSVSLFACKHHMRTYNPLGSVPFPKGWQGAWVAGFTGSSVERAKRYLFYLMRVAEAFSSHYDAWRSPRLRSSRRIKATRANPFGDLYEPKARLVNEQRFDHHEYKDPIPTHKHQPKDWRKDINYLSRKSNRRAALLVGDQERSYVWYRDPPTLGRDIKLGRWTKKVDLQELYENLLP